MMTSDRLKPLFPALVLALCGAPGCVVPADGDSDGLGDDEPDGLRLSCDANVSVEAEAEATILVEGFRTSLSEMISCGRLAADLAGAVQTGIADAIIDNRADATPQGWTYAEEGLFIASGAQAQMRTRFYLGADFDFAPRGTRVEHNVFRVDSYLVGAQVRVPDPLSLSAELHFEEPGPLVELLGFGSEPSSPISVELATLGSIGNRLSALHFESDIAVAETGDEQTLRYDLHTERMEATALVLGSPLRYDLQTLVARTDATELEVSQWSAEFFSNGWVEGTTTFDVLLDASLRCDGTIDFPDLPRPSGD